MRRHHLTIGLLIGTLGLSACANPTTPSLPEAPPILVPTPPPDEEFPGGDPSSADGQDAFGKFSTDAPVVLPELLEPPSGWTTAAATRPVYVVFAVSGGLHRNNANGFKMGTNFQGTINAALAECIRNGGGSCEVNQYCTPPQLSPSRPFVAVARSSVFNQRFLDRGVTGWACGKTTMAAAQQLAVSQCAIHGCYRTRTIRAY
jgi:hypothetical protein